MLAIPGSLPGSVTVEYASIHLSGGCLYRLISLSLGVSGQCPLPPIQCDARYQRTRSPLPSTRPLLQNPEL